MHFPYLGQENKLVLGRENRSIIMRIIMKGSCMEIEIETSPPSNPYGIHL